MADLAERHPGRALALSLDVTSAEQRAAAVQQTEARFGTWRSTRSTMAGGIAAQSDLHTAGGALTRWG
jgi:hypothetical protein